MVNEPVLTRVVKLQLKPDCIDEFKTVFIAHKNQIQSFEGCVELNAYQDSNSLDTFFTISRWHGQHYLNNYRYSEFFKTLWSRVKPMFAAKAEAYSMFLINS